MVKYEELLESNIESNNKVETINKTLHNLNSLFKASGCDEQICEIIEGIGISKVPNRSTVFALFYSSSCSSDTV